MGRKHRLAPLYAVVADRHRWPAAPTLAHSVNADPQRQCRPGAVVVSN